MVLEAKLIVARGSSRGREIPLPLTILTIGRARQCHLRPHCSLVSRFHCAVARWAGKVVVRDLRSANGTFVNGRRVEGEVRVSDGDTLRVGTLVFTFRITPSVADVPLHYLRESDVRWLVETPADAGTLDPADTHRQEITAVCREVERFGAIEESAVPVTLSAGEYLHDYLRLWKQSS